MKTRDETGDETRNVTRAAAETGMGTGTGAETGMGTGAGTGIERKGRRGESSGNPPHHGRNRVEDRVLLFRTQHRLYTRGVAIVGSRRLRAQDSAPVRRSRIEGKTINRPQEREEGNGNGTGMGTEAGTRTGTGVGIGTGTGKKGDAENHPSGTVVEMGRKTRGGGGGDANGQPAATAARPDATARTSHHAEDPGPGA